jgi:hypothetical protein
MFIFSATTICGILIRQLADQNDAEQKKPFNLMTSGYR